VFHQFNLYGNISLQAHQSVIPEWFYRKSMLVEKDRAIARLGGFPIQTSGMTIKKNTTTWENVR